MGTEGSSESVGARVRRLRLAQGKSQRDIEGPGADHAHISRVERGQRSATDHFLRTVARSLGVGVEYLRTGEEGTGSERRRARLSDLELQLRLEPDLDGREHEGALRQLHAEAVANGDFVVARRCRMLIGCAAAERGANKTAVHELQRLVDGGHVSPLSDREVFTSLGRSLAALGRAEEAVALFEDCLAVVERLAPDDTVAFVRYSTFLSYALVDARELLRAKRVLREASARAAELDDLASRTRLYYSRARLAWAECDWERGRDYAARAIALLEIAGDTRDLARMHLMTAEISLFSGEHEEAEKSAAEADALLDPEADSQDLAFLLRLRAFLAARHANGEDSVSAARRSLALLAEDPAERGRSHWALAEALVAADRAEEALDEFAEAYRLMAIEGRFIAQLLCAWACALRELGRHEEATEVFLRAVGDSVLTTL